MARIAIAFAFVVSAVGPVVAQGAKVAAAASTKVVIKKDTAKADDWMTRDLSGVLTKVTTIKLR